MTTTEPILDFLRDPRSYPENPDQVEVIAADASWIALAGESAYKVRQPIEFDDVDYTTPELREKACQREMRLNRRLGGDIYLGVAPIYQRDGRYSFQGDGEPADYALRMKRLPSESMLDRVLAAGEPDEGRLAALADLLSEFYASARAASKSSKAGSAAALETAVQRNFKALAEYCDSPDLLDPIESAQLLFLAEQRETLERRVSLGKVRDVHADLRAEHVCLSDPPIVVGCTEPRERERCLDVLCDLASLLVDMETAGRGAAADRLAALVAESLEEDPDEPLWDFYKSFRALSSARREALRPVQSDKVRRKCLEFVHYARERIGRFYAPRMFVTVGLIGSGKSTLAHALAGEFGLRCISSEEVRDELFPDDPNSKSPIARLDLAKAEQVYARLLERARASLEAGVSVVLDAGFFRANLRKRAVELARAAGVRPLFLDCRLSKTEAIARVDQRFRKHRTKSPPRPELYEEQVALFEPPDELPSSCVVVLNLSQPVPDLVEAVRESLE